MGGRLMLGMLANTPSSYWSPDQLSLVNCSHARIRHMSWHQYRLMRTGPVQPRTGPAQKPPTSRVDGRHDLVADVEVGENVLHVVAVLERVDQLEHLARRLLVHRHR